MVSITLDCQVQGDYAVTLLSGEKGGMKTALKSRRR